MTKTASPVRGMESTLIRQLSVANCQCLPNAFAGATASASRTGELEFMSLSMPPERLTASDASAFEPLSGHVVVASSQQRLRGRFSPPEGVERNPVRIQIDLGSNQAVGPVQIHQEGTPHEVHLTLLRGPTQKDHTPVERSLEVGLPSGRKRTSRRSCFHPLGGALVAGGDVACRLRLQSSQRIVMKACPDLGLPAAVEILHGSLKPRLTRWSKDRGDVQAQAETAHPPQGIGELVCSLKARVVIELSISGQPEGAPMLQEGLGGPPGGDGAFRPGGNQAPLQRGPVQDFHFHSAFDHQAFHDVEAVQFALGLSDIGKIPARWRRRSSLTPATVQGAAPLQDASDGAPRRQRGEVALSQVALKGGVPILAQGAALFQFSPHGQNQIHGSESGPSSVTSDGRTIVPLHAIQALTVGATDPVMQGRQTHVKATGHGAQRFFTAPRRNHRSTPPRPRVFESCSISVLAPSIRLRTTRSVREALTVYPFGRLAVAPAKAFGRH